MMNAKQNTDTERLDFLFKIESVEFSRSMDGRYVCYLPDSDVLSYGIDYRDALDEALGEWEEI